MKPRAWGRPLPVPAVESSDPETRAAVRWCLAHGHDPVVRDAAHAGYHPPRKRRRKDAAHEQIDPGR